LMQLDDVKELTERQFERALVEGVKFSRSAAKAVASIYGKELDQLAEADKEALAASEEAESDNEEKAEDWSEALKELTSFSEDLQQKA